MPAPELGHIMETGLAFWASKTLLSAIEMEVFTELAKRPEDLDTLTGRLGLHPRSSRDFLDALVALGFLERHEQRKFVEPLRVSRAKRAVCCPIRAIGFLSEPCRRLAQQRQFPPDQRSKVHAFAGKLRLWT